MFIKEKYNELLLVFFLSVLFNYAFCFLPESEISFQGLYKQTIFLIFISWLINKISYSASKIKRNIEKIKEKHPNVMIRNTDLFYSKNDIALRLSVLGFLFMFLITDWSWLIIVSDFFLICFSVLSYKEYKESEFI